MRFIPALATALGTLAFGILAFGLVQTASAADMSQEQFNKMMGAYLQDDANVEAVGNALENFFRKKRADQAKAAAEAEARELEEQFKNPIKIDIGNSPVKGPKDAPVTIIEFSDFQCPFCAKGAETIEAVGKEYGNKVKIVFKHLPLPFHPEAKPAAQAAIAADRQGKFWEMHDKLFENQSSLGKEAYVKFAEELGLDLEKFKKDLEDPAIAKMVEQDAELAQKLGVRGTPGFFINGVQLRGAQPLPKFKEVIDRWLNKG